MNKKYCAGCYNDFYNGQNNLGIKECWSLRSAKRVLRKRVHIDQVPPWNQKARLYPDCYTEPKYIFVGPNVTC